MPVAGNPSFVQPVDAALVTGDKQAAHSAVKECAVIGVPDPRWGEVGHLFAVSRPGADLQTSRVRSFLEARIARYKLPKHVTFIEALPRNGAGKVEKNVLRLAVKEQGHGLD